MSIKEGDIISYNEMCSAERCSLQRGMNFRIHGYKSIILMSRRKGAPYIDIINEDGTEIIYEGHDLPKNFSSTPKAEDQPRKTPKGTLTQNGKFEEAVNEYKTGKKDAEIVKVYEKLKDGIWVYNGKFSLVDCWNEQVNGRNVYKFKLIVTDSDFHESNGIVNDLPHNRVIPSHVKQEVFVRDKGKCIKCGSTDNLHFDHILPYSKGGTSLKSENIQLLCARHNLEKSNKLI